MTLDQPLGDVHASGLVPGDPCLVVGVPLTWRVEVLTVAFDGDVVVLDREKGRARRRPISRMGVVVAADVDRAVGAVG